MPNAEYKYAFFDLANGPDQSSLATFEEFAEIIRSTGCAMHIYTGENGRRTLTLQIDCETAKNSRNAGRRKKLIAQDHWRITCGEVRQMLTTKTADEVAEELGISRSTLFRRLKDKDDNRRF